VRNVPLVEGEVYHIFSKSIAGFKIFRDEREYKRMLEAIRYYLVEKPIEKFSVFLRIKDKERFLKNHIEGKEKLIKVIAYCIMPTHIHLILKQVRKKGISIFMANILNSYTRGFNVKTGRKGPLWEGKFKNVLVETDEQLIHLTRYLHLNPITAYLVKRPEDWKFSSYREFLGEVDDKEKICNYSEILDINPVSYKKFVNSHIEYQRELANIRALFLE
jgi:putative transposase